MNELARGLFASLLTEFLVVVFAILLKDDKRKVALTLAVGTLVAGLVCFAPQMLNDIRNSLSGSPSVENTSPFTKSMMPSGKLTSETTNTSESVTTEKYSQDSMKLKESSNFKNGSERELPDIMKYYKSQGFYISTHIAMNEYRLFYDNDGDAFDLTFFSLIRLKYMIKLKKTRTVIERSIIPVDTLIAIKIPASSWLYILSQEGTYSNPAYAAFRNESIDWRAAEEGRKKAAEQLRN